MRQRRSLSGHGSAGSAMIWDAPLAPQVTPPVRGGSTAPPDALAVDNDHTRDRLQQNAVLVCDLLRATNENAARPIDHMGFRARRQSGP